MARYHPNEGRFFAAVASAYCCGVLVAAASGASALGAAFSGVAGVAGWVSLALLARIFVDHLVASLQNMGRQPPCKS